MGSDKNLCECDFSFYLCINSEIREQQFSLFLVILSERIANFCLISHEDTKITEIWHEQDSTIQNWSEKWFCEKLKIAFKCEFSLNALTYH